MNLVRTKLEAAGHTIDAWVARTREQRKLGLMHCQNLGPTEGMLFVCDECAVQKFWMKDTPLPLSIAFIGEDGTIVHIDDMDPHTLDSCSCDQPVRYVLEMAQGWFREHGIEPGTRLVGPVFLAAASAT